MARAVSRKDHPLSLRLPEADIAMMIARPICGGARAPILCATPPCAPPKTC